MMKRTDILIALALGAVAVMSRLPFLEPGPFYTDSFHLLKGIKETGVAHPPGYIGYVMAARVLSWVVGSPHFAMLAANLLATFIIAVALYLFGRRLPDSTPGSSALMVILFLANPFTCYYGEVSLSFIAEAMTAVVTALFCWEVINGKRWATYASAAALALGASVRQTSLVFLLPLWVGVHLAGYWPRAFIVGAGLRTASAYHRSLMPLLAGILIIVPLVLVWMIPTVILYEPLGGYSNRLDRQMAEAVWANSIFMQGWLGLAKNGAKLLFVIFYGMNATLLLYHTSRMHEYIGRLWLEERRLPVFLGLWVIPPFLFYLFIFTGPPGYIFILLPALYLPLAGGLKGSVARWAIGAMVFSASLFLFLKPLPPEVRTNRLVNVIVLKYTVTGIEQKNSRNLGNLDGKMPRDYGGGPEKYER